MYFKRLLILSALLVGCSESGNSSKQSTVPTEAVAPAETATKTQKEEANTQVAQQSVEPIEPVITVEVNNYTLKRGQTITHVLKQAGFSLSQIYALAKDIKPEFDFKKIKSGTQFDVVSQADDRTIRFASGYGEVIEASLTDGKWQIAKQNVPVHERRFSKSFEISQSLYKAASNADIPANVINSAVMAMSHFVDFQREIRKGDKITLNFSQSSVQQDAHLFGKFSAPQKLVAIEFTNNKDQYQLYQFEDAYYFSDGKLAQNFLMKTPLNGARLSSYFGKRKHPVLGYNRQHKGIDFSAPVGTPIMAAGKGKVLKANYSKSFGYRVLLEHSNGYRTLYAHLKGFAKGIRAGARVKQGQTIGYLGNTGMSTARHLHYEVHKHGRAINPLTMKQPSNIQLKGQDLVAFKSHIKGVNQVYGALNSSSETIAD